MASNSILKLQVDDKQYEASLKNAQQGLTALQAALRNSGKSFADVDKQTEQYVRELGKMEATAKTTRGRIGEMSSAFVELSRIEKQLTDQERQSPVGKALTESLAQLKQRTIDAKNELQGLENQIKNVGEVKLPDTGGLFGGGKLDGMLQVFGGNVLTKIATGVGGMLTNLASEMGDMVQQGIELAKQGEGIRIAFERLGRGDILDGLRQATHGTVTDLELMKAAVKFDDFNLPLSELGTMLAFAQQKAKDTGQSVDYMVDSIVTGLGRKSLMILDNLGLSATEVKDRMAETGDMTKAVGEIIREQMAKAGDYVETAADRAAQANVNLQNKMEELGRKFAPVEEASNQLWTSMKIGILDIVGGPLARLLNGLTEAGRLKNMLSDLNGGEDGKPTEVERQVNRVKTLQRAGGDEKAVNTFSAGILEGYSRKIMTVDKYVKQFEKDHSSLNKVLVEASKELGRKFSSIHELKDFGKATGIIRDQFAAAVKDITKPVDVSINTSKAEQNVETLRMKLIELEAQRKKAVKEGDQAQVKSLTQQINATKTNIRALDPTALKTGTTSTSPQQRAEEQIKDALSKYNDAIELATKQMEAGNITEADFKNKLLSEQQRLYDAYGQAYRTYADPKYKDAQQKAADEIVRLGGEVKTATEAQKKTQESARQLEQAQKELAKYEAEAAAALKRNDLTSYYAATSKVEASKAKIAQMTTPVTSAREDELAKSRKLQAIKLAPKEFTISANDEDALAKVRKIQGVAIKPKEFSVTADTDDAMTKLREVVGEQVADKAFTISATDEALPLLQAIEGVDIEPKTFVVTAETADAMTQLREVMGEQVPDKTFTISATDESLPLMQAIEGVSIQPKEFTISANDEEALAKVRKILGVKLAPKEFTISANDEEALAKVRKIQGVKISPKDFIISTDNEEALAKVQKIQGIKLTPKEFTITATDEEALAKVRKILGVRLAPKEFAISANDEDALAKVRKIQGVAIKPKEFSVTATTDDAMTKLREVVSVEVNDKDFTISATDESLPLLQAIEGVDIEPKTFVVTAETADAMTQLREVVGEQVPDKVFTISATDESLPLLQAIEGVSIQPKEFTISANDEDALAKVRKIQGVNISPKDFIISTDNEEALAKVQKIQGIKLTPKEFTITATDEEALAKVRKILGVKLAPKEFTISADDEDALAKVRKIQGVAIKPKEFSVTATTDDAMTKLRELIGAEIGGKEFTISANDESLPLLQAIEGVNITPKEFSVTATTDDAMAKLREVVGEQVSDKAFTISATDESLPLLQAIEGVSIEPKTFVVTAETADAMSKLREVIGEQLPDKAFTISATDESLPLLQAIEGVSIQPKTFAVTAETADAMSQLREVVGEQVPDKEFIISATDESLPLMKVIEGVSITPKEFNVTANTEEAMAKLLKVVGAKISNKEFIISASDEEALAKARKIDSVKITPKEFVITADDEEALAKVQKYLGIKLAPKEFTISANDEEALAKARKIDSVKITPKEFVITATDEEALAKVQKYLGIKLAPKEFTISANDEEALAKARKIDSVKITPKTFVVTAETEDAMSQLREVMGEQVPDKTFIISATDESLPLMQAIEGVSIQPKTFAVTAETADAMSQLREVIGEQVPDKEFIISATDESLPLLQAIEGVDIEPKTFVVTAETADALSQLREVIGEQIPDKAFTISATDESLPLLQAIEGITITPKEFSVTASTDDAMTKLREVVGAGIAGKEFTISATDESLPLLQAIEGVVIAPKEFVVTANTEQAQESIKKLDALSEQTEESLTKTRKPQGQQNVTTPNFTLTQKNLSGFIGVLQKKFEEEDITIDLFGDLTSQLNDAKMLSSAIQTALKNGLNPAALGLDNIWQQVFNINPGDYIDDSQWEELRTKMEAIIGKPIEINFQTGEMKTLNNDAKSTEKSFREAASAVSSVSSALQQLEDPSAKIAGIIGQAIANIALGFAQATASDSKLGVFGWIAAITGGLATMVSTISAIHNATGYAQGGIVKGSTYSGDRVQGLVDGVTPVGLNAGEVVLNHSQQATLAAELTNRDNSGATSSRPYVDAETIYLGVNNYLKRSGRGEIVTTKNK